MTGATPSTATTLRTEVLGDGNANCLERALSLTQPGDSVMLLRDKRDGVGHALVLHPDGSVVDPNLSWKRYGSLEEYLSLNPRYTQGPALDAGVLRQVLSQPPGPRRDAILSALGLGNVANQRVADPPPQRWVSINSGVNVRDIQGNVLTKASGVNEVQVLDTLSAEQDDALNKKTQGNYTWIQVRMPDGTTGYVAESLTHDVPTPPPPRFPEWVNNPSMRPDSVPQELWNHLPPEDRAAVNASARRAVLEQAVLETHPELATPGTQRPSDIPESAWLHIPPEAQHNILAQRQRAAIDEQVALLSGPIPAGGQPVQNPLLGVDSSFGLGTVGDWSTYSAHGNAVQYLNLREMLGKDKGYVSVHNNLCGPLSVAAALGKEPAEALRLLADKTNYAGVLKVNEPMNSAPLAAMFKAAGWDSSWDTSPDAPRPQEIAQLLAEGKELIALVGISSKADGMLREDGLIAHFINVRAVEQQANGQWMVRVYNPFQNREEVYSWADFTAAWHNTNGNESTYAMLVATPPAQQ
ncbi:hypothetical protein [Vitiosangium sp. GDMCC 1.1324]|uniref:hypothetical protein n=1 Tax=Vitiosangium sp. (strain GDMCC 1.1324) TaxID=2138576 RepID=UPI000D43C0AB|nr:hypothetical protein [Vitiosangium sp. GDMCC 1.1324]PTL85797.1 hypothetical protein DAT35_03615 [Vitiosangium sp. GDMCC 1.1324]